MSMIDTRLDEISDCLYRVSAKIIVIQDSKLLMTIENNDKYGLPGGGIDHGESITQTLDRELMEELGLSPDDVDVDPLPVHIINDGVSMQGIPKLLLFFKARLLQPQALTHAEVRYEWLDAAQLQHVIITNSAKGARGFLLSLLRKG
jgi:8-oxo-dGTP pyrophosphatase MutT (NUDIX family)